MTLQSEQLARWLRETGECEAADLAQECSLQWIFSDELFDIHRDVPFTLCGVNIQAPGNVFNLIGKNPSLAKIIESALEDISKVDVDVVIRDIHCAKPSRGSVAENVVFT